MTRYRDPLVALLLLALPFVFYVSNAKESRDHNAVDRVVVWVSAPVQWLVVTVLDGVSRAWHRYVYLVGVEEENEGLRRDNAALLRELDRREEYRLENERLRRLTGLREVAPDAQILFARVIATSPTPLFRSLRVDRGTADGVTLGAAVINQDGVVGRVAALAAHWSDVMLLVDAQSSIEVVVQRTRARARVRGLGADREFAVEVEYLGRTEDVSPNDVLVTSGIGTVFPKGLTVGTITETERQSFGLYQHAVVEPSVDFSRLEEVMILPAGWPEGTDFNPPSGPSEELPGASSEAPQAATPIAPAAAPAAAVVEAPPEPGAAMPSPAPGATP